MWLLDAEAGIALFLLIFIVWWTAFSGKKPNNRRNKNRCHRKTTRHIKIQCSVRGNDKMNSGILASNCSPSSATQK